MSGVFNPAEPGIFSTDNEQIAKAHGLTEYDEQTGLYTAKGTENGVPAGVRNDYATFGAGEADDAANSATAGQNHPDADFTQAVRENGPEQAARAEGGPLSDAPSTEDTAAQLEVDETREAGADNAHDDESESVEDDDEDETDDDASNPYPAQ